MKRATRMVIDNAYLLTVLFAALTAYLVVGVLGR